MDSTVTNIVNNVVAALPPHGQCWLWTWPLIYLHVISDLIIALSYFAIPGALLILIKSRPDIPYRLVIVMFATFIVACGLTHIMGVVTIWKPWFWLDGYIKLWTALVSAVTAISLYPLLPALIGMKSKSEYEKIEQELRELEELVAKHEKREKEKTQ